MTSFTFTWKGVTVTVEAPSFNKACHVASLEILRVCREQGVAV